MFDDNKDAPQSYPIDDSSVIRRGDWLAWDTVSTDAPGVLNVLIAKEKTLADKIQEWLYDLPAQP